MKLYGHCFQLPHEKTDDRPSGLKQVDIGKDDLPSLVDPGLLAIPCQRNGE